MDELNFECSQQTIFLQKQLNKRNKVETIYVGFYQNNSTDEVQVTLQNHTSYFLNMKYIQDLQHLIHTKC